MLLYRKFNLILFFFLILVSFCAALSCVVGFEHSSFLPLCQSPTAHTILDRTSRTEYYDVVDELQIYRRHIHFKRTGPVNDLVCCGPAAGYGVWLGDSRAKHGN